MERYTGRPVNGLKAQVCVWDAGSRWTTAGDSHADELFIHYFVMLFLDSWHLLLSSLAAGSWVGWAVPSVIVCLCSKRKMVWAVNAKVGRDIVHAGMRYSLTLRSKWQDDRVVWSTGVLVWVCMSIWLLRLSRFVMYLFAMNVDLSLCCNYAISDLTLPAWHSECFSDLCSFSGWLGDHYSVPRMMGV